MHLIMQEVNNYMYIQYYVIVCFLNKCFNFLMSNTFRNYTAGLNNIVVIIIKKIM